MDTNEITCNHVIDSLESYIKIIKNIESDEITESYLPIIYRGEERNYYEFDNNIPIFNSSAFRENPIEGYETGVKLAFKMNLDLF